MRLVFMVLIVSHMYHKNLALLMIYNSLLWYLSCSLDKSSDIDPSEWNSLFTEGNLGETLDFLDPTTGVPTPLKMAEGGSSYPTNNGSQSALGGFNMATGNASQGEQNGVYDGDRTSWLMQQSQKLERQQAMQQQKLLELEQVHNNTQYMYMFRVSYEYYYMYNSYAHKYMEWQSHSFLQCSICELQSVW